MMDMPLMEANGYTKDSLIGQMKLVNSTIDRAFGKVQYSAPTVKKNMRWTTEKGGKVSNPVAHVLLDNGREFGQMDITFDARSKKIRAFYLVDAKAPVPSMIPFWLFMLAGICNAAFIIYVIIRVRRSSTQNKKRKYALAALLNLPTISLHTMSGISLQLLHIQFLLGSGFSKQGFLATWELGLPLGACIVLYKLRKEKKAAELEKSQIEEYLTNNNETSFTEERTDWECQANQIDRQPG